MPSKQGGKGKTSSPSRAASHKRGPARTLANKALKIARHARRCKTSEKRLATAGGLSSSPAFPRRPEARKPQSLVLGDVLTKNRGAAVSMVFVENVLIEISTRASDIAAARAGASSRLQLSIERVNPLTGARSLVEFRPRN